MNNRIKSSISTNIPKQFTEQLQLDHQTSSLGYSEPLSPKQLSEGFFHGKLSYSTVLHLAKTGELPFHKIGQKYFTWLKALEEWRDQNIIIGGEID